MSVALQAFRLGQRDRLEQYAYLQVAQAQHGAYYAICNKSKDSRLTWQDFYNQYNPAHAALTRSERLETAKAKVSKSAAKAALRLIKEKKIPSWFLSVVPIRLLEDRLL